MHKPTKATALIDSRHLKILVAKKKEMKDSIVFVCLDEDKYGTLDKAGLRKIVEHIETIEPDGIYFPLMKRMHVEFYDVSEFRNKDVVVAFQHDDDGVDKSDIEAEVLRAIPEAKSVRFIHNRVSFEK